ncbi:hypothetical protein JL722_10859 [Aureococcus anophagefferens]|nr:hypothetical protein JL722_10859 [Aureococcus anophagefferens]
MATRPALLEVALFLRTLRRFDASRRVYVASDTAVAAYVSGRQRDGRAVPRQVRELLAGLDEEEALGSDERMDAPAARRRRSWRALDDGAPGVLFADADVAWLAPLPPAGAGAVGVSPCLCATASRRPHGAYNGGHVFARTTGVLDLWRSATSRSRYMEQAALEEVYAETAGAFLWDARANVEWLNVVASHSVDGRDHAADLVADGDTVAWLGRRLLSAHAHVVPTANQPAFQRRALGPMLDALRHSAVEPDLCATHHLLCAGARPAATNYYHFFYGLLVPVLHWLEARPRPGDVVAQHGAGQANMALLRGGGFAGVVEICPKPMMYKSIFQCLAALRGVRYARVEQPTMHGPSTSPPSPRPRTRRSRPRVAGGGGLAGAGTTSSDSDDDLELEGLIACQETTFHEAPPPPRSPSPAGPDYAGLADLSRERLACRVAEPGGGGAAIRTSWAVAARPGVGRAAVAYTTTAPCGRTFGSCCADDVLEFLDLAPKKRRTPPAPSRGRRRRRPRRPSRGPPRPRPPPPGPTTSPRRTTASSIGWASASAALQPAPSPRGAGRVYREADGPLYDLVYDDGFRDARLPARFIRDVVRASPLEIRRADSRDWIFFESQAIALRQLGPLLTQQMLLRLLHSKAWDDDPFRARRVDAKAGVKIRNARDREQDDDFRPNRAVGDPVLAQYDRAGIFYKGTISKVHDGGRAYDVRYEDGDEELDIDAYYVLDADDPRGAEGVKGLDGLVEAEPPRPAKQAKKRPRDEKPAKKKDRDETFPRPPRPVEVRRRGSDAWTHFASLSKAAKHYKNLPAWLVQRLVSDPTLKHDVFECRAADAAPPPAKKARGACEAGAVVVLRSGGCWRRGVADGEGAVAFEDGKTRAVDAADVGLAVLGGGA